MAKTRVLLPMLFLMATLLMSGPVGWGAEGIILKAPAAEGNYCHLKFPAIREETLFWDRPVLKDPSEGDIIDFYGPCNHDPLGKAEILHQREEWQRRLVREAMDGD